VWGVQARPEGPGKKGKQRGNNGGVSYQIRRKDGGGGGRSRAITVEGMFGRQISCSKGLLKEAPTTLDSEIESETLEWQKEGG